MKLQEQSYDGAWELLGLGHVALDKAAPIHDRSGWLLLRMILKCCQVGSGTSGTLTSSFIKLTSILVS